MTTIHDLVLEFIPHKRKQNIKGWITFDAPCCHHRGHNRDKRGRGNMFLDPVGSLAINCYNCGFKSVFKDDTLTSSFETWMIWLGVPQDKIQQLKLELLTKRLHGVENNQSKPLFFQYSNKFPEIQLPDKSIEISNNSPEKSKSYANCVKYLEDRGNVIRHGWKYFWSNNIQNQLNNRIIIPFMYYGKIVGWTGRYAGKPNKTTSKYFNGCKPQNYLFNADVMAIPTRKFIIISEGPLDAIATDGVGALGKQLSAVQISWINSFDKEVIILPDREKDNQDLIDTAISQGWSVSFPEWEQSIKDAADASKLYGKLCTIHTVLKYRTDNKLQIGIKRKMFKG
jgi:hypothetical protein